ncbi:MAG: metallophosphoesterase family protein [Pseudomonadota bacterium]
MGRILAIGDIHGCYAKLVSLMEKVNLNPGKDALVFIGDYIDRGDRAKEVVDYLIELKKRVPSTVFLLGNHEHMLLDYLSGENTNPFLFNGGQKTLNSYLGKGRLSYLQDPKSVFPPEHLEFFNSLLPYYELEDTIFVHAGLRNGIPLERQDLFDLLWIREEFYYSKFNFGKTIVFGHTAFSQPFILNNRVGIDTGAVYGNTLTCVELPAMNFYSV